MFGHLPELAIVLLVALIVFGPEKLPEVAANVGRMMRDVREAMDTAMNPAEPEAPDDFSTYYYEAMARNGESVPEAHDGDDSAAGPWPALTGGAEEVVEPEVGEIGATPVPPPRRRAPPTGP